MKQETPAHILVVDDDERLRLLLSRYLREHGFAVTLADNASYAERAMALMRFDLMVLDVMMPGETGIAFANRIRPHHTTPILMLSALGDAKDRILGLEAGVEDYLAKPFEPRELLLRMHAILRRSVDAAPKAATQMHFGQFRFDLSENRLWRGDEQIHLTTGEVGLLKTLAEHVGQPVSREALAAATGVDARSIDVQITRLRKKIEPGEGKPMHLQTVRGSGYVLYSG